MERNFARLLLLLTMVATFSPQLAAAQSARSSAAAEDFTSFTYARLGQGAAFGSQVRHAPAFGFGFRGERKGLGLDVSLFNYTVGSDPYEFGSHVFVGSHLKLEMFHYLAPQQSRSPYVGGGLSWGIASVGRGDSPNESSYTSSWDGGGLQGELTAGYEVGRSTNMRLFVQTDASLPFSKTVSLSSSYSRTPAGTFLGTTRTEARYLPSVTISVGVGWQWRRH